MSDLLRAELLKLRTTRTFVALVSAALLLGLAGAVLGATVDSGLTEDDVRELMIGDTSSLFILILAVVGMTGEWRHRTITGTVLAAPDRARMVLAKMAAYAVAGVLLSLVVNLVVMTVTTIVLSSRDELTLGAGELAELLARNIVTAAVLGALGVAIGAVVRNQLAAVIGVVLATLLVEPILFGLAPDVGRFGPLAAAPAGFLNVGFDGDSELLGRGAALLVMLAWVAALGAAAVAAMRARDVT